MREYREIKTKKDIEDFDWATGNFHDACIEEQKILDGGELYLRFTGIWGCQVEIWFWDDLEYCTDSRKSRILESILVMFYAIIIRWICVFCR